MSRPGVDPAVIDRCVRAAIKRSGISGTQYAARMRRITRTVELLLSGRSVVEVLEPSGDVSQAELYGALWMLVVADVFRDDAGPRGGGIVGSFLLLTETDVGVLDRAFRLLHERYFGIAPLSPE